MLPMTVAPTCQYTYSALPTPFNKTTSLSGAKSIPDMESPMGVRVTVSIQREHSVQRCSGCELESRASRAATSRAAELPASRTT